MVHRGESERRNPDFPDVSAVSSGRENPGLDLELVLVGGSAEGLEPGVVLGNRSHRLVGELLDELDADVTAGLVTTIIVLYNKSLFAIEATIVKAFQ